MKIPIWDHRKGKSPNANVNPFIKKRVQSHNPDIICITEGDPAMWEEFGHIITAEEDYGYPIKAGRRKAFLISKKPWSNVDTRGSDKLPSGRFIRGTTQGIDVVGVCIPWSFAHVKGGHKNRSPWEDHSLYLDGLKDILPELPTSAVVMGDFNQRIPRKYATIAMYEKLQQTFKGFDIHTNGLLQPINKYSIDHFYSKREFRVTGVTTIDNFQDGVKLSDHFGVVVEGESK